MILGAVGRCKWLRKHPPHHLSRFCHMCLCSDCLLFISLVREGFLTLSCVRFPNTWHSTVDGWAWQQLISHIHPQPRSTCCFPLEYREQEGVMGGSFVVKRRWGIPGFYKDVVGLWKQFLGIFLGLLSFWKWHSPTQLLLMNTSYCFTLSYMSFLWNMPHISKANIAYFKFS